MDVSQGRTWWRGGLELALLTLSFNNPPNTAREKAECNLIGPPDPFAPQGRDAMTLEKREETGLRRLGLCFGGAEFDAGAFQQLRGEFSTGEHKHIVILQFVDDFFALLHENLLGPDLHDI